MEVEKLTRKELAVFKLVMQGRHYNEIAEELDTSHDMIKYYRKCILRKLRARTSPQAVSHYYQHYTWELWHEGITD